MNAAEVGALLAEISAVDGRRVDEASVIVWLPLVDDLDLAVAREAVRLHRRETPAYLVPAHVRANVARILASAHPGTDEWGNELPADTAAQAALARLAPTRLAVTS